MVAPHYYASTSGIIVDRFLKYGLFEFIYGATLAAGKSFSTHDKATRIAQAVCAAGSAILTTGFLGLEADALDKSAREAVATEMGIDPKDVQFSDFKHSKNPIVNKAYSDLIKLQVGRYGTDLLFMAPTIAETAYGKYRTYSDGKPYETPPSKLVQESVEDRITKGYNPGKYTGMEKLIFGPRGLAMSPYAGKAAYWAYETYKVDKTSYYEIVKLRETVESTGKDLRPNDLKSVYQRLRNDKNLPLIRNDSAEEHKALQEIFTRMADAYNKHDGKFGMDEIVYLLGNKVSIHEDDNITFSKRELEQSLKEIDHVVEVGLKGVREENRQSREALQRGDTGSFIEGGIVHTPRRKLNFTDRIVNTVTSAARGMVGGMGLIPKRFEERVSPRDPTDIIGLNR